MASNDINSELDFFRERWRAEVRSKIPGPVNGSQHTVAGPSSANTQHKNRSKPPKATEAPKTQPPVAANKEARRDDDEDEHVSRSFDEPVPAASSTPAAGGEQGGPGKTEPVSALEHFEQAVEREAAGNLGDSLRLYRKAYRMDHRVDLQYRKKHFPQAMVPKPAPSQPNPSNASPTVPNPAHHSSSEPPAKPPSLREMISSFAGLSIQGAPPEVEGSPPPPCPISSLPGEILVHILRDVAVSDIASFVRLARVCKRLAYLVATEDQIWRRVCLGPEFGFGGMHYRWQASVTWGPLDAGEDEAISSGPSLDQSSTTTTTPSSSEQPASSKLQQAGAGDDLVPPTASERSARESAEKRAATLALFRSGYGTSWQRMFRARPRIRFGGCYISTVNYLRSGQASAGATTWHSPVHIVTYYRYLRFYRDGTCVSLLSTAEPADVVHHLAREALLLHRPAAQPHLPSVVMQNAYKGRWRLGRAPRSRSPDKWGEEGEAEAEAEEAEEAEGDVFVETEGVGKYLYRLDLALGSSAGGKAGPRNNKLVWSGFYSYNRLTDDWAEFGLKNYKPFYFSRVRSYGI